jgi:hypothetical protein
MVRVVLTAAQILVVYLERGAAPEISSGVAFLTEVLVVWTVWGLALGAATAVLSTAFDVFRLCSVLRFVRAVSSAADGIRDCEGMGSAIER